MEGRQGFSREWTLFSMSIDNLCVDWMWRGATGMVLIFKFFKKTMNFKVTLY